MQPVPFYLSDHGRQRQALRKLFLLASLSAVVMFLPFIILDGGRFSLIADFNHQQIPFNMHSAWAIKNGQTQWDWYTGLGVNFIGAFSFYTLGSPFFWLSLLLPPEAFPYLAGWLYVLKYVAAAAGAFFWLKRYVRDPDHAVLGALLYAFSGFSHINLMYYHFHEALVLFPLLLFSLDRLVLDGRRGWFALLTALSALMNYFFFFGEVIFLILYFLLVYRFPSSEHRLRAFLLALGEGALGVLAASVLLLPSALFIRDNPKTSSRMEGMDLLKYPWQRYLALVKALFFPAEAMARQSAFLSYDFSSASLYLPAFGLSLALAGIRRSPWKKLLALLALMAAIPGLNAPCTLLNAYYYARWFFMPVLLLAAVSSQALETVTPEQRLRWIRLSTLMTLGFALLTLALQPTGAVPVHDRPLFISSALIALAGLIGAWVIQRSSGRQITARLLLLTALFSSLTGIYSLSVMRSYKSEEPAAFAKGYLFQTARMPLAPPAGENQENFRASSPVQGWNLAMLDHVPSVNSFITTVSPSVHEFFDLVGISHLAATVYPEAKDEILTFLSVRYRMDLIPHRGWIPLYSESNGKDTVHVSENPDFIPLGFPLDRFITRSELLAYPEQHRARVLLKAKLLEDQEVPPGHLTPYSLTDFHEDLSQTAREKRRLAVTDFSRDSHGFQGSIQTDGETTVLFTVPWDSGWKARIDGQRVPIHRNAGFMAIEVPHGTHALEFRYRIPGLTAGILLSSAGFIAIALLLIRDRKSRPRGRSLP